MKHISSFKIFLEYANPNTPQGYVNSLSNKPKPKTNLNTTQQKPTDEIDGILQNTEEQKQKIIARKDVIEKGLLNNIKELEPENQKDVKTQVNDYKDQVKEFDKTVTQISKLNQTLNKSNVKPTNNGSTIKTARQQNQL